MTALERATYSTKSFLTAFALVDGHLTADQAAQVALVEVQSQIELWGEVEDCQSEITRDPQRSTKANAISGLDFKRIQRMTWIIRIFGDSWAASTACLSKALDRIDCSKAFQHLTSKITSSRRVPKAGREDGGRTLPQRRIRARSENQGTGERGLACRTGKRARPRLRGL